jgi:hypothetical protein
VDGGEPLAVEPPRGQGDGETIEVTVDDRLVDAPAGAGRVPAGDDGRRKGEDDGHGRDTGSRGARNELAARGTLDVRRVDDDESPEGEPANQLAVEDPEGQPRRSLVRGVARDRLAVGVRREDLGLVEEAGRERRLARAGRTDENDQ